jgi:hypothetical protein
MDTRGVEMILADYLPFELFRNCYERRNLTEYILHGRKRNNGMKTENHSFIQFPESCWFLFLSSALCCSRHITSFCVSVFIKRGTTFMIQLMTLKCFLYSGRRDMSCLTDLKFKYLILVIKFL